MRSLPLLVLVALALFPGAAPAGERPRYQVELRADRSGDRWAGRERLAFTNAGPSPLRDVWLRLWPNGVSGCSDPALRIHSVRGATRHPSEVACTAVRLSLDRALPPGERGSVAFEFDLEVPAVRHRFGVSRGVRMLSNALPILALRDGAGWRLDPFSRRGETFVSELSDWRVRMELPAGLEVAAPGSRRARRGRVSFTLSHAREFSWAAGRLRTTRTRVRGVSVRVAAPRGVPSRGFVRKVRRALRRLTAALGPNGRPEITVVMTPRVAMEHAGLAMAPDDEPLVAHELAHLWWYDLLGSDQSRAPWLDEGFAQWSGWRAFYPDPGIVPKGAQCGPGKLDSRLPQPMSYWARHRKDYAGAVYFGGACLLDQVEAHLGRPTFAAALRGYVDAHRWGWHTAEAFMAAMDAAAGDGRLEPVWERFGLR